MLVRRNLVVGWHLQPNDERTWLTGIARENDHLTTLGQNRRCGTPFQGLGGHRLGVVILSDGSAGETDDDSRGEYETAQGSLHDRSCRCLPRALMTRMCHLCGDPIVDYMCPGGKSRLE